MAEKALKKLEEQLNCSICLDTYTDPKQLQCNHVYCQQCLVPLLVRDQQGQLRLTCPTCRQVTPIPDRGVAGLQPAFQINRLLEIQDAFQKDIRPASQEGAVRGIKGTARHCFEHPGEELKLYCETCGELVCYRCALKGGKHQGHDYEELVQAFQKYKEEITSLLDPMEEQVTTIMKALAQFDTRCGEISEQEAGTKDSIRNTFKRVREVLDARETKLISQVDEITLGKLKDLAAQRDQIETNLAQLCSCLHSMRESLKTVTGNELMMKTNTLRQVEELTTSFQPDILKPNIEADTVFSTSADMTALCQKYGQIASPGLAEPFKCHDVAVVGEKSTAILQAINFGDIKSLECEVASEITGTRASCCVERRGQSQYEISYQPTIKGRHQLHIKAEGQHVRGSPFSVAVESPVERLGTPILAIGDVKGPWGVSISHTGEVVVSEASRHRVSIFGPSGAKIQSFGTHGSGQGQFQDPRGVAVDGEGNILIVDGGNHRIQKFTAKGQFLSTVGSKGSGLQQFSFPTGIAYNKMFNLVYVVDSGNHRVQVLYSDLSFAYTFGEEGILKGQFRSPLGIACDSTGKVYVADSCNNRVQILTATGGIWGAFGWLGHQKRKGLDYPFCVAVDSRDIVYVSESGNHLVTLFDYGGCFVASFGRRGVELGEFHFPHGLAVDDSGVVYVCDSWNNRIQIF